MRFAIGLLIVGQYVDGERSPKVAGRVIDGNRVAITA